MKPYILGAICVWFVSGLAGTWLLGEQHLDVPKICGGPMTLWNGFNAPPDS